MAPEPGGAAIRCRIIYSGRVQGVFFRATAREIAQRHGVAGYARNQPDGTVELEAEGTPEKIEAFLTAVAREYEGYITAADRTSIPARGDESTFEIRY
jgi:acylphosphatase